MPPLIDSTGKITDWCKIMELEGVIISPSSSSDKGILPGFDFEEFLGSYKSKKLKITIEKQLEG